MKNRIKLFSGLTRILLFLILLSPVLALAQVTFVGDTGQAACTNANPLLKLLCTVHSLLNFLVPVLIALGVVYFIWGIVIYVIADGEEAKKKGKDRIIFGIIGFAVIFGFWGLVKMLIVTFGLDGVRLVPRVIEVTNTCAINNTSELKDILCYVTKLINNSVIPLLFAVAGAFFVWGMVRFFVINADEEAKREQGRQFMIWAIIAFTVMLSVWGLVGILGGAFGINTSVLPQVCPPQGC